MKFLIQMMVMFGDVIIVLAAIVLLYAMVKSGNVVFGIFVTIMLITAYKTWKETGGFIAWTKKGRKAFFENWDKMNEE